MKVPFRALLCGALFCGINLINAGEATFDFETDPGLEIFTNLPADNPPLRTSGGNPGGYLAITDAANTQGTKVIFPDFDDGLVVTAFKFSMDVRIGNGTTDRPADGFSINYARSDDPVLETNDSGTGFATSGANETGTSTGLAISFDAWAGNALPDGPDIEGIIVRLDNETILRQALPTRNGAAGDITSAQTGLRDPATAGDPSILSWQPLEVELDEFGRLSVSWKGSVLLNQLQTDFFPSPGRLVFAGRTGDANQNHHVDNIHIETTASDEPLITGLDATPNGVVVEITDATNASVQTDTIRMMIDGVEVDPSTITAERIGTFQNEITYRAPELFEPGSEHVVTITYNDQDGNEYSAERPISIFDYGTVSGAYRVDDGDVNTGEPGFRVRPYQVNATSPNTIAWSEDTLRGENGDNVANLTLGRDADNDGIGDFDEPDGEGFFSDPSVINYEINGLGAGNFQDPNFADEILTDHPFPGLPGFGLAEAGQANAVQEIVTYLHFPEAKVYRMGVNSDDGFKVSVAPNYRDAFGQVLGFFNAGRGSADTIFNFLVEEPGYYPFRLLWFQGGGGANLEWFTIKDNGSRVLINDPNDDQSIKAYQTASGQNRARISSTSLNNLLGGTTRPDIGAIELVLEDGSSAISTDSVSFTVNGLTEDVDVSKSGGTTTLTYDTGGLLPSGSELDVEFSYTEGGDTFTYTVDSAILEYPSVSVNLKSDSGSANTGEPGFRWRTHQVAAGAVNTIASTEDQLDGNLGDNIADGEFFDIETVINFEQAATAIGNFQSGGAGSLAVPDDFIPGIPGTTGSTDNIAAEALTFIEFPSAGLYEMGVNSDDGFLVSVATDEMGLDASSTGNHRLGLFDAGRGAADTLFVFGIPEAGVYPFRLLWFEGGGGANVEWFSINPDGTRYLINQNDPNALKAYRSRTWAGPVLPVATGSGPSGAVNAPQDSEIFVEIQDGQRAVAQDSIVMTIDGEAVGATVTRDGDTTRVSYQLTERFAGVLAPNVVVTWETEEGDPGEQSFSFRYEVDSELTFPAGTRYIEVEDFNFTDDNGPGQWLPGENGGPTGQEYTGGAYAGLAATHLVDYFEQSGSADGNEYRQGALSDAGEPLVQFAGFNNGNNPVRGSFTMTDNWKIGWTTQNDWYNFTRDFPEQETQYWVWSSMASGGAGPESFLELVESDPAQPDATTTRVARFGGPASGDWGTALFYQGYEIDDPSTPAIVTLNGTQTVRWVRGGGDSDLDHLAFVPVSGGPPTGDGAVLGIAAEDDGSVTISWDTTGTLQSSGSVDGPYSDVAGASSPFTTTPDGDTYYRVVD